MRQAIGLGGDQFEGLGITALRVDFQQLAVDGDALRVGPHRFLEDFLGLQIASVGQVDVRFRDRVDVASSIELARRIHHRRSGGAGLVGIDPLTAASSEEGVRLQPAFQERAVNLRGLFSAARSVKAGTQQQRDQAAGRSRNDRVRQHVVDQGRFNRCGGDRRTDGRCRRRGNNWGGSCGCDRGDDGAGRDCSNNRLRGRASRRQRRCGCQRSSGGRGRRRGWGGCGSRGRRRRGSGSRRRRGRWTRCGSSCADRNGSARPRCACCAPGSTWSSGRGTRCGPEFVQVRDVLVELGNPGGGFPGGTLPGNPLFIGLGLDASLGQGELVGRRGGGLLFLHGGLDPATGLPLGVVDPAGGHALGQFAPELVEVPALRHHCLAGFASGNRACLFCARHFQHSPGFEAVDVAAREPIRIGAQHGDQHLVK